jgi:hypothetical protein
VRRNECLDAARNELHAVGITHTVAYGGKHLKIKFKLGYRNETYVVSVSCCDSTRGVKNSRADIRRMLRRHQAANANAAAA